jgi:hypothetical protein
MCICIVTSIDLSPQFSSFYLCPFFMAIEGVGGEGGGRVGGKGGGGGRGER